MRRSPEKPVSPPIPSQQQQQHPMNTHKTATDHHHHRSTLTQRSFDITSQYYIKKTNARADRERERERGRAATSLESIRSAGAIRRSLKSRPAGQPGQHRVLDQLALVGEMRWLQPAPQMNNQIFEVSSQIDKREEIQYLTHSPDQHIYIDLYLYIYIFVVVVLVVV